MADVATSTGSDGPENETPNQRQARLRREKRQKKMEEQGEDRLARIKALNGGVAPPDEVLGGPGARGPQAATVADDPEEVDISQTQSGIGTPSKPNVDANANPLAAAMLQMQQQEANMQQNGEGSMDDDPMVKMMQQMVGLMGGNPQDPNAKPPEIPPMMKALMGGRSDEGRCSTCDGISIPVEDRTCNLRFHPSFLHCSDIDFQRLEARTKSKCLHRRSRLRLRTTTIPHICHSRTTITKLEVLHGEGTATRQWDSGEGGEQWSRSRTVGRIHKDHWTICGNCADYYRRCDGYHLRIWDASVVARHGRCLMPHPPSLASSYKDTSKVTTAFVWASVSQHPFIHSFQLRASPSTA